MSTWFSMLYEVGATVGPTVAGAAMVRWGANGLPLTLTVASVVCALFMIGAGRTERTADADNRLAATRAPEVAMPIMVSMSTRNAGVTVPIDEPTYPFTGTRDWLRMSLYSFALAALRGSSRRVLAR